MIRFACPQCHKGFQVEDKLAGRKTKCPNCHAQISVAIAVASHSSAPPTTKAAPQTSAPSLGNPAQGEDPPSQERRSDLASRGMARA